MLPEEPLAKLVRGNEAKYLTCTDTPEAHDYATQPVRCCPSVRLSMALLMFMGSLVLYINRVNMSVAIVCITDGPPRSAPNATSPSSLQWTKSQQGLILSSFFIGYTLTQIPTGWIIHRVNVKWLEFGGMSITCLTSVLSPSAARWHWGCLVTLQIIKGLACGTFYPCQQCIVSHWSPPNERASFAALSMLGAALGSVVSFALSGFLCDSGLAGGWPSIFYVYGLVSAAWLMAWALFAHDTPAKHSCISQAERLYLEDSLREEVTKRDAVPWRSLLTCPPFWALVAVDFCYNWLWCTSLTSLPTYYSQVLHFDIARTGVLSALPFLLYLCVGLFGSVVVDYIALHINSLTALRKVTVGMEMLVPAALIVAVGFTQDTTSAVVLLTLAIGLLGLCRPGHFVNMIEIAPSFAGQTMSVSNTISNTSGILAPVFAALLTYQGTQGEWRNVFILAAAMNFLAAIFYFTFGSGDLQRWARVDDVEQVIPSEH